jgi:serine protease
MTLYVIFARVAMKPVLIAIAASVCAWAAPVWASASNEPVVVAVIDSGFMTDHPSLQNRLLPGVDMVSSWYNLRGGRSTNVAPDGREDHCKHRPTLDNQRTHGTEVASVVVGNGQHGVNGVAQQAKVLPVRAIGVCGMQRKDLIDAMAWSVGIQVPGLPVNPHPARIVNISLSGGGLACSRDLQTMVDRLVQKGVFVVAAAGNTFGKRLQEPANCQGVISVGAVNALNEVASYSAVDERTVVYAFGGSQKQGVFGRPLFEGLTVASLEVNSNGHEQPSAHERGVGTSFAAPVVAGYVANLLATYPSLTPQEFVQRMPEFTSRVAAPQSCSHCQPMRLSMANN